MIAEMNIAGLTGGKLHLTVHDRTARLPGQIRNALTGLPDTFYFKIHLGRLHQFDNPGSIQSRRIL